jgi:hypothetical protein
MDYVDFVSPDAEEAGLPSSPQSPYTLELHTQAQFLHLTRYQTCRYMQF